jgi:DNA-directed RNA polymerase subunit F
MANQIETLQEELQETQALLQQREHEFDQEVHMHYNTRHALEHFKTVCTIRTDAETKARQDVADWENRYNKQSEWIEELMRERDEARAELADRYLAVEPTSSTPPVVRPVGESSGAREDEEPAPQSRQ